MKLMGRLGCSLLVFCWANAQVAGQALPVSIVNDPDQCGGFIITSEMMSKKFYEITWPGTHNSHANDHDEPGEYWYERDLQAKKVSTQNQFLSVREQLENGIRLFTFDLIDGDNSNSVNAWFAHGSTQMGKTRIVTVLESINAWLVSHPDEFIIIQLGDFKRFTSLDDFVPLVGDDKFIHDIPNDEVGKELYNQFLDDAATAQILDKIYNIERMGKFKVPHPYDLFPHTCIDPLSGSELPDCYDFSQEVWPTLQEMKDAGKQIIMNLAWDKNPYRSIAKIYKAYGRKWGTQGAGSIQYMDQFNPALSNVLDIEESAEFFEYDDPSEVTEAAYTLYATPDTENHDSADKEQSERMGSGFRIYEAYKGVIEKFDEMDRAYHPTYIQVDFFRPGINTPATELGSRPDDITVVDAANRLNIERLHGEEAWTRSNLRTWSGRMSGGEQGYYWNDDLREVVNSRNLFGSATMFDVSYRTVIRGASDLTNKFDAEAFDVRPDNIFDGLLSTRWASKTFKRDTGPDHYLMLKIPTLDINRRRHRPGRRTYRRRQNLQFS